MIRRDSSPLGVPCWVDTRQPDPDAAAAFYADVFGWQLDGGPGYRVARLHGGDVAAIGAADAGRAAWTTYVRVDDADTAVAMATDAGGRVAAPATDLGDAARCAVVTDPAGAAIGLWQPGRVAGAQLVNYPGTWNWSDLATTDPAGAVTFYGTVFG